jgi:protein-tyrosine-phosphatase
VSYHLRLLRDGGLVGSRRSSLDARDSYYHLDLDRCAEELAGVGTALHPALRMVPIPDSPTTQSDRSSVLFVCSGNSARSPIAEALLRHRAGNRVRVSSAGTRPKDRIHPQVIQILRERYDIDVEGQAPRALASVQGRRFDRVVTLCDKAREAIPDVASWPHTHWSIADPAAGGDGRSSFSRYLSVAADIDTRVRHLLPSLST